MTNSGGRLDRLLAWGPIPWAVAITAWAVPGFLAFFMPHLADLQFGDGEPASWIETGETWWLAGLALVVIVAVSGGYWLPRGRNARRRHPSWYPDAFSEFGLLGTAWSVMLAMTLWTVLVLDGDPSWLVWLVGGSAAFGICAQAHQLVWSSRQVRMARRQQQADLAKRRGRH